ncbi:Sodium channel protein type 11 subunit alpha [Symbiodinium microadriaticum]|uniref:Sodium channel protein type 11 subunit alpha n=1 Tax=Symbiodinium microadriaticum TaxID=2951 RepID=A0A1Q9EXR0_SYMMI|nr:Sodium channel protein type 11 subunit alpha [Symbiodinium microadriaticum]
MPILSQRGGRGTRISTVAHSTNSQLFHVNATEAKARISAEEKAHLKKTLSTIEKDSLRYKSSFWKPWLDEEGNVIWSSSRIAMAEVVLSQMFETIMGIVIAFNIGVMVVETNMDASCQQGQQDIRNCAEGSFNVQWLQILNIVLLVVYSVECAARAYVERSMYIWNRWNQIDLLTVLLGWGGMLLASAVNLNVLRLFRVVRLMRAARVVISVPEFYILVSGLSHSLKAIVFGSVMLLAVILVWAAMSSWFKAKYPFTIPILFLSVMTISLGVMNLILAVIVERAAEARENDQTRKMQRKDAEREKHMVELALLCDSMDRDGSGSLSLEEMLHGFDNNHQFASLMQVMDIRRTDMETIFNVLDHDSSGEVSYVEFCQQLGNFRKRDPLMMNSLIRYSVMELRKLIRKDVMNLMSEHTELLTEQYDMLNEQLDLLASVPGLEEKAKEASSKRRSAKVLRRQGKSQGKPQIFFDDDGTASDTALSYLSAEAVNPAEIIKSLETTCQDFENVQGQLNGLLAKAEQLTLAALEASPALRPPSAPPSRGGSKNTLETDHPREGDLGRGPSKTLSEGSSTNQKTGVRFRIHPHPQLEEHFASLLNQFHKRVQEEESFQERCRHVIRGLDDLMEGRYEPGAYFAC